MGVGSAFASGYGQGAQSIKNRSFMPMINSLTGIINQRNRGQGVRIGPSSSDDNQTRADRRREIEREDMLLREEKARYLETQARQDKKDAESTSLLQQAEQRKQEAHEQQMAQQQQTTEQKDVAFDRTVAKDDRAQAYEMAKQGLMMRDAKTLNKAMQVLAPSGGEDLITEEAPVDGARSFKARPGASNLPMFIFDPDSETVGVTFPGQAKPAIFKNAEEAFKNVLAPINPANEKTKDQITAAKNQGELDYKNRDLRSENWAKADEAGRSHAIIDGVFQADRFDPEQYKIDHAEAMAGLEGRESPRAIREREQAAKDAEAAKKRAKADEIKKSRSKEIPKDAYRDKAKPPGFPDARRGKGGVWFIPKDDGWAPLINDEVEEEKEKERVKSAGVPFNSQSKPRGVVKKKPAGTVIRKKMPARITAGEGF